MKRPERKTYKIVQGCRGLRISPATLRSWQVRVGLRLDADPYQPLSFVDWMRVAAVKRLESLGVRVGVQIVNAAYAAFAEAARLRDEERALGFPPPSNGPLIVTSVNGPDVRTRIFLTVGDYVAELANHNVTPSALVLYLPTLADTTAAALTRLDAMVDNEKESP